MELRDRIILESSISEQNPILSVASMSKRGEIVRISGLILLGALLAIPIFLNGYPVLGHDTNIHLAWYTRFADQLWSGEFYPRWLMDLNAGYGDAVFFFYGPLPYYLTSILRPLFSQDPIGWYQMGVSASIALIFSGIFAYIWLKEITNPIAAFIGAGVYMLLPYHLGYDLYIRGAFGEFFAFIWLPLMLYFVHGIIEKRRVSVVGVAISYAALVLTHLSTTLIFSLIPVLYVFFIADKDSRVRSLRNTAIAMLLGLGLSAIYLLPAMGLQRFVSIDYEKNEWLYQQSFLFVNAEYVPSLIIKVSIMVLSTAILGALGVFISRKYPDQQIKRSRLFWIVVGLISFFMMTPLSKSIVEVLPIIQIIQFPSRFNTVFLVAVSALFTIGIYTLYTSENRWRKYYLAISGFIILGWMLSTLWIGWQQTAADKNVSNQIVSRGIVANEYWPKWVQIDVEEFIESAPVSDRVSVIAGDADVSILEWKPREILLSVDSHAGASLILHHFYFPGWKVCNEDEICTDTKPTTPDGYITFDVPDGRSELSVLLFAGREEEAGKWITIFSVIITIFFLTWTFTKPSVPGNNLLHK